MTKRVSSMSFSDLQTKVPIMADNILINSEKIGKYGLELPDFAEGMKTDVQKAADLDKQQERLKSELKAKTEELDSLRKKLMKDYSLCKKTVKLAEPQVNWKSYGLDDKQ